MKNVALITGATAGIGLELARLHAQKGRDLVLIARRENILKKIKSEFEEKYNIQVEYLAADLSLTTSALDIFSFTQEKKIEVDYLINNAGFGGFGKFYDRQIQSDLEMIQVNITSLVELTHLFLTPMIERKRGAILNVASTAGFLPGPLQATYFATKSFVLSFTQGIAQELKGTNVTATALCPGPVATDFIKTANLEGVEGFKYSKTPESVALCGYKAMEKGKLVIINDKLLCFLLNWVVPFLPRGLVLKLSEQSMTKVES